MLAPSAVTKIFLAGLLNGKLQELVLLVLFTLLIIREFELIVLVVLNT
jgi:hypothetical protein